MSELEQEFAGQLRILGVERPERELRFAPPRRWRFDFAWPAHRLAVEIEGGTWVQGAHTRGRHFERDAEKYNAAALAGWRVLRFTTDQVADWRAAREIEAILAGEDARILGSTGMSG